MHARRTLLVWFGLVVALLAWNGRIVIAAQPAPAHSAATPQSMETSLPQRVIAIDASSNRTCAVTADGKVWCWPGRSGQSDVHLVRGVPVQEMPFDARAVMVARGSNCVVTTENRILCWVAGNNNAQGQVRELSGFTGTVRALATGSEICALNDSGTVFCWNMGPKLFSTHYPHRERRNISVGWRPYLCSNGRRSRALLGLQRTGSVG